MYQSSVSPLGQGMPVARLILSGLEERPMSGRELLSFLAEDRRIPLEPGALLAALRRLEQTGLISPIETDSPRERIPRYRVTDTGMKALYQQESALLTQEGRVRAPIFPGMFSGVLLLVIKWILRLYPPAWRERYEEEMIELLGAHEITLWTWLNLLWNALDARLDPFYRRSARLSPFRRLKRVQRAIMIASLLPLASALFYFFLFFDGLHDDYWIRNEHYPLLALSHNLGSIGFSITLFSAWLTLILLAYQGIKRFEGAGNTHVHQPILVAMCLPFALLLLIAFAPPLQEEASEEVAAPMLMGSLLLLTLLLVGWILMRRAAFQRALLYLLPWLGIHLFMLTLALGPLLYTPQMDTEPFYGPIALLSLLSAPLSFAASMVWLRLGKGARTLLALATAETLGMTLVQAMMFMRIISLNVLGLSAIWTSELIIQLSLNVLCTVLALAFLLSLLPLRGSKAPPPAPVQEWEMMPLS